MHRDLGRLASHPFDLLVIGGGVYGLIVARDAADRGLDVALVERADFGSQTSFNHLRTIHGGLRYLQTLDIARARESIRERRALAHIAPDAVQAVPFVLPLQRSLKRGPLALRAAFFLDGLIAGDRNLGVADDLRLPPGRVVTRSELLQMVPALESSPAVGAAIWFDYVATDADRLTFSWAAAAARDGAVLANYVEATALRIDGARIIGASALDRQSGQPFEISARCVVNATGGAVDRLLEPARIHTAIPMIKAMNLVTTRPAASLALGGQTRAGKTLFTVPWKGRAIVGTWESTHLTPANRNDVDRVEVESFLGEINEAFPGAPLRLDDVSLVHRGIVPAVRLAAGRAVLDGQEHIHDHDVDGIDGLISVAGTKYTTARGVAERVVDLVAARFQRPLGECRTASRALPLVARTGDEGLRAAAQAEMVVTLEDAVVRRTSLGALGDPGAAAIEHAAEIVGGTLSWSAEKRRAEIAALGRFYGTVKPWNT